jgi:hypothetical protein
VFDRLERKLVLALGLSLALSGAALAQGVTGADPHARSVVTDDCEAREVDYRDDESLTREERIARMDRAFTRSLNRFAECQSEQAATASGGASGGGDSGGAGDAGNGESGSGGEGLGAGSVAASDISGSDAPPGAPSTASASTAAGDIAGTEVPPGTADSSSETVAARTDPGTTSTPVTDPQVGGTSETDKEADPGGTVPATRDVARTEANGRVPGDIPPADNDSVLEAQIRTAAMEEEDPELRKRLWDEYRRYKGLPPAD